MLTAPALAAAVYGSMIGSNSRPATSLTRSVRARSRRTWLGRMLGDHLADDLPASSMILRARRARFDCLGVVAHRNAPMWRALDSSVGSRQPHAAPALAPLFDVPKGRGLKRDLGP